MTILGNNVWQITLLIIELNGWIIREIQIRGGEVAKVEQELFKGVDTDTDTIMTESGARE